MPPDEPTNTLTATVDGWKQIDRGDPFGANDLTAEINQVIRAQVRINGVGRAFDIWHLTGSGPNNYTSSFVVRAELDSGKRSKNPMPDGSELFVKSRGIPWDSDKAWTYLSEQELQRRSAMAGLGRVTPDPETPDRYRLYLGVDDRPPITNGTLNERLVEALAKTLVVMQSGSNPT